MPLVSQKEYDQIDEKVKQIWDQQAVDGRMTNMKRTLAHSYPALRSFMEWYPLKDEIAKTLGERTTIIFVHAISSEIDCLICSTYFRRNLIEWGENPDDLIVTEKEQLLVNYGKQLVKDANNIPGSLIDQMVSTFSEKDLVDLTAFAGLMIATNIFNNALKIDLDEYLVKFKKEK